MAVPLTFSGPSIRGVETPITLELVMFSMVSSLRKHRSLGECMHHATFGQLHFESVLALRFRAVESGLSSGSECHGRSRFPEQDLLRVHGTPGPCAYSAHGQPRILDSPVSV